MATRTTPSTARVQPATLDRAGVRELEFHELGRTLREIAALRFALSPLLLLLAGVAAWYEGLTWKVVVLGFAAVMGLFIAFVRNPGDLKGGRRLSHLFAAVFSVHTVIILVTGGLESPFVVLYLPVTIIFAVGTGERRQFVPLAILPIGAVWVLTVVHFYGAETLLRPRVFGVGEAFTAGYWLTFAFVMSVIMIVGGMLGMRVRHALDRAVAVAAQARAETLAMSQERNHELMEMLGALAHELKNPLACIQGLSELVVRSLPANEKPAEQMKVVNDEAHRMGAIIEEFLTLSRPLQALAIEQLDPQALCDEVIDMHEYDAQKRGMALNVTGRLPQKVHGDPRKLKQVLVNLVVNALEAAESEVAVKITPAPAAKWELVVEDDGEGFGHGPSRFFTPGLTTKSGGSGLGLTIARVIVEQHQGTLELQDRQHGGGRVVVTLPIAGPDLREVDDV